MPPPPPVPAAHASLADASAADPYVRRRRRALALRVVELAGRSSLPLLSLALLASTLWWGPWGLFLGAFLLWRAAGRFA